METQESGKKTDSTPPPSGAHGGIHIKKPRRGPPKIVKPPVPTSAYLWRQLRVVSWLVFIIVLLAVIAVSLHQAVPAPRAVPAFVPPPKPVPGPVLGNLGVILIGLKEVAPPMMPSTVRLAPGSAEAQARQIEFSKASALPVEVENSLGIRLRLIPPGSYVMGSPETETERWEGESQHTVNVYLPFYMSVCEITQEQWSKLMPENPSYSHAPVLPKNTVFISAVRAKAAAAAIDVRGQPVEEVTWADTLAFAKALAEKENVRVGTYRLPFEAEWEYACRAGTKSAFCFGDDPLRLEHYADFVENNARQPNVVGRRLPNAYGLFDLHGNVWEWCMDKFAPYPRDPGAPPPPPALLDSFKEFTEYRVIRGGNWCTKAEDSRSATRSRLPPLSHGNMLGFRLVRLIPEYKGTPAAGIPDLPAEAALLPARPASGR